MKFTIENPSEVASCPYCNAKSDIYLKSTDRNRNLSNDVFVYYKCASCGLIFLDPLPQNLEQFYQGGYQPIPASVDDLRVLADKERYRLEALLGKDSGDLLEIGPWIGVFSVNAKDAGFNVDVIEMDIGAAKFLREKVGINVVNSSDPVGSIENGKRYDVIAMWHSLEHLVRPWEVLEAAARNLKPGGLLIVAIPNIDSVQARFLGSRWVHLDAPRHLYFWSAVDLARLINKFGLETVCIKTDDKLSRTLSLGAWGNYLQQLVPVPLLRGVVTRLLSPLAHLFSQRRGRGAGLTAVFRAP